jgi:glutamate carboxypeptidase
VSRSPSIPRSIVYRAVSFLEELCAISSASGDAQGVRRAALRLGSELEEHGFSIEIDDRPSALGEPQPLLMARSLATGNPHVLLLGHLDTVLPATQPLLRKDRLQGTGALDMKAGFATLIGALDLRSRRGQEIPTDLVLVAVPDEEVGGAISETAVRTWGEGARAVVVLEPGQPTADGETIVTGRRGLSVWRLEAEGRSAHSGLAYSEGRSALAAAAGWAADVQAMSKGGGGPIVNVGRIVGGDSEFVEDLGEEHRFVGTSQRLNVVADRCLAEGEVRYLSLNDRARVLADMRDLSIRAGVRWGVDVSFEVVEEILPMPPSGAGRGLAEQLVGAAADDGWRLELETDRGGVSFANFLPDPAAVPVLDGLGPVGSGMHTRDEYVSLVSLRRRIGLLAHLLDLLST